MPDREVAYQFLDVSSAGGQTRTLIPAPGSGKALWVFGIFLTVTGAGTVKFQDGGGAALTGSMAFGNLGQLALQPTSNPYMPWFRCPENTAFQAVQSADAALNGVIVYAPTWIPQGQIGKGTAPSESPSLSLSPSPSPE